MGETRAALERFPFQAAVKQVLVKVLEIDKQGKIRLSRKALLQDETGKDAQPAAAGKKE